MLQHLEKCELVQEILSQNFKISESEPRSPGYSAKSAIFDVRVFHAVILHDLQDVFYWLLKVIFCVLGFK